MAALERDQDLLESVLCGFARSYADAGRLRTLTVFDRERGQFLLMNEGWDGYKHIEQVWVHVEFRDGKFWVQQDGTREGVAVELVNAGIPRERIVLGFLHPARRRDTEFAAA
jgi:hypothetical protein